MNYNKPNYYVAFLNGLAENTDDLDSEQQARYDFEYFAFGLNQSHLETAKQRLEDLFDAILILERPETYVQLERWFEPSNDSVDHGYSLPHQNRNQARLYNSSYSEEFPALTFTREEFYRYNVLDKELYNYALELSLSKSARKRTSQLG